jgi:hypothetical protein
MKPPARATIALLTLLAAVVFAQPNALCGDLHSGAVQVLPSQFPKTQPSSQLPVSSNVSREVPGSRATHGTNNTNGPAGSQSRSASRPQAAGVTDAGHRREDAVCTHGNPTLIGLRCSTNSECNWGARCVGVPAKCANTGAPCVSAAGCLVPGICSADTRRVSGREGEKTARSVPASHVSRGSPVSVPRENLPSTSSISPVHATRAELPARRD